MAAGYEVTVEATAVSTMDSSGGQYDESPMGLARRWRVELECARDELRDWQEKGDAALKRYLDVRESQDTAETRWNLFHSNIETKSATLYGQTPKVSVGRRFADAQDDVARVAGEMLERQLNSDIEKDSDTFAQAVHYALQDRLLPGMGQVRIRYVADFEDVPEVPPQLGPMGEVLAPAVPAHERKTYECVETDYVPWRCFLWSPCRVWHEVRWVAFEVQMSRPQLRESFGDEIGNAVPLDAKPYGSDDTRKQTPWQRATVWEIWDKETRRVLWLCEGYPNILKVQEDPLQLESFFPCPMPMLANTTTSKLVPRPDYYIARDLYVEVDTLSTRINLLVQALRVAGVYDRANSGLQQLLSRERRNELIPVDNWAAFGERGGLRGAVDWMPIEQVAAVVTSLRDYRREVKDALFEVTGMADILRGASDPNETAAAQGLKARFGSVRLQAQQDEVARFASDVQRLKAEVVAKFFDPQTIIAASNVMATPDAQHAMPAVQLLKDSMARYRVEVKPESISLTDFAAMKSERVEMLGGVSQLVTAAAPLLQMVPNAMPFILQLLQWFVSGMRGSSQIEGVIDAAIASAQAAAQQPKPPPPPDPKLQAQQLKGQQDLAKIQAETQADMVTLRAEVQADAEREQNQAAWNVREAAAKQQLAAANRVLMPKPPGVPNGG